MHNDLTVIIRTTNERTLDLSYELIAQQIPQENIVTVQEVPASRMVRRTHELAIEHGRKWSLAVDADVLLGSNAIQQIIEVAEGYDTEFFLLYVNILDKLAGGPRPVGIQLFRTKFCSIALQHLPSSQVVRPDSHVKKAMQSAGYPTYTEHITVGLHDFEQYYRDIYRKGFKHANKYKKMRDLYSNFWKQYSLEDADYQVALWGLKTGIVFDDDITIDISKYPQQLETMLNMKNLTEKKPLPKDAYTGKDIDRIIQNWKLPPEYYRFLELDKNTTYLENIYRRFIDEGLSKTGYSKFLPWSLGAIMKRAGTMLMKWSTK